MSDGRHQDGYAQTADAVRKRLARNLRVRRTLPQEGRLRIDRQLPFLCVYRRPPGEDAGTRELVTSEAAYLFASGDAQHQSRLDVLLGAIADTLQEHFGILLFLEVWAAESDGELPRGSALQPQFEIVAAEADALPSTVEAFEEALRRVTIGGLPAEVRLTKRPSVAPPGMRPLLATLGAGEAEDGTGVGGIRSQCVRLGLAVRPVYRNPQTGALYPVILQRLRRQLSSALRQAIFAFTGMREAQPKLHFDSLGPTSLVKAARLVDQQLCEVSESFDFLLQVTPVNSDEAWETFQAGGCREAPPLLYRPLPYHPSLLKRRLFEAPIERIEDPTLAHLFWQKQVELDRQITTLRDIGTRQFLYGSLQLYGRPSDDLVELARRMLLMSATAAEQEPGSAAGRLTAAQIAKHAREEIDWYHKRHPSFSARVEVCDHIAAGLMVAGDRLFVSESFVATEDRVDPLLHHEVGTHLLTYFNGREQPFRQLYAGLAGYEPLQEGLAVLAEHFVGGLRVRRLRTLAARVIAVQSMLDSLTFAETFRLLTETYRLRPRAAFTAVLRAYRAGGLTKDFIYLRGLRDVLAYLEQGHEIEPLFVGKIGLQHVPFIQELRRRGIIQPPALLPRYMQTAGFRDQLAECREKTVLDLLEESFPSSAASGVPRSTRHET